MTENKYADRVDAIVRDATEQIMRCVRSRAEIEPASRAVIEREAEHVLLHAVAAAAQAALDMAETSMLRRAAGGSRRARPGR